MAKKSQVELVGIEDVERILNQLPNKFQASVINAALKEAARPLYNEAVANLTQIPWGSDLGRIIRQKSAKVKGIPGQEIGAMPTKRRRRSEAVWEDMGAYWMEYGTMEKMSKPRDPRTRPLAEAQRRVGGPPSRRGRIPAYGWFRKAITSTAEIGGVIDQKYRNILWKKFNQALLRKAKKIQWSGLQ